MSLMFVYRNGITNAYKISKNLLLTKWPHCMLSLQCIEFSWIIIYSNVYNSITVVTMGRLRAPVHKFVKKILSDFFFAKATGNVIYENFVDFVVLLRTSAKNIETPGVEVSEEREFEKWKSNFKAWRKWKWKMKIVFRFTPCQLTFQNVIYWQMYPPPPHDHITQMVIKDDWHLSSHQYRT